MCGGDAGRANPTLQGRCEPVLWLSSIVSPELEAMGASGASFADWGGVGKWRCITQCRGYQEIIGYV